MLGWGSAGSLQADKADINTQKKIKMRVRDLYVIGLPFASLNRIHLNLNERTLSFDLTHVKNGEDARERIHSCAVK